MTLEEIHSDAPSERLLDVPPGTEGELLEAELQMEDLPWGRAAASPLNMDMSQGISWGLNWWNLIA